MAAPSQTKLIVLNLKAGMPTVEQAKRRLLEALYAPRGGSGPVVKIIHGYGSSGTGGAIRSAIREQMAEWQRAGKVLKVVPGENWSIFDADSQDLRQRYAFLSKDEDLDRGNAGMTLVEFPADTSRIFR
ncbi:MAG: Smr/MutS family protein [Terriglobales bacterium]